MRLFGLVIVLALGLSGCAADPSYPASVAAGLERRVLAVARECADGQFSDALAKLGDVQSAAAAAQADGHLSPERQARIMSAIDLVRQDLQAAIEADRQKELEGTISSLKEEQQKLAEQQKEAEKRRAELEQQAKEAAKQDGPAPDSSGDSGSSGGSGTDNSDNNGNSGNSGNGNSGNSGNNGNGKSNGNGKGKH